MEEGSKIEEVGKCSVLHCFLREVPFLLVSNMNANMSASKES